jgi:hypothetical protein
MSRRVLLVEGNDDARFVEHFCRAHGINVPGQFSIDPPCGEGQYQDAGVDRLLDQAPVRLKTDIERLAVILDADEDAETRWIQLRDRLRRAGFDPVPDIPGATGTIMQFDLETRIVRLGVWIMPDNRLPGMLEDFLAWLVPAGDRMLPHVDRFLDTIPPVDRLFSTQHKPKARIHSYLAVQKQPGKPLGLAITFKYLDANRLEVVGPFLAWLRAVLLDDNPVAN